jgi:hypothetical protein
VREIVFVNSPYARYAGAKLRSLLAGRRGLLVQKAESLH